MTEPSDFLPAAVRAYTPARKLPGPRRSRPGAAPAAPVLVLDTESTTDAAQGLTFGCWRVLVGGVTVDEGLFHGDDLAAADLATLREYAAAHRADTADAQPLRLLSRRDFVERVFWRIAYKARGLVVGFNLPFDLGRLAVGWGEARGDYYGGGFSLVLWDYERGGERRENRYRPRLTVKSIDSKRALVGFTRRRAPDAADQIPEGSPDGRPDPAYAFPGHVLDLKTLAFALTNDTYSLERACAAFGVEHGKATAERHGAVTPEYVDYARRDVLATAELLDKLLAEHARHPIDLTPTQAFSPASVGKAYLGAMGVRPPLARWPDFPLEVLGHAMVAYYGGRAECRIRRTPVPVVYVDFLSMYPTVNALMGLWELLTAERIDVVDATDEVRHLLEGVTLDACFEPGFWRELPVLVQLEPDGDVLPVRAKYGGRQAWQIGLNELEGDERLWTTLADCVASSLLAGKPPTVVQALRLVPAGRQPGLQPVALRGSVAVDPAGEDFFRAVVQQRKTLPPELPPDERTRLDAFLKVLANATSYGVFAEMNRQELGGDERARVTVHGLDPEPFVAAVVGPEEPGAYCFPPLAAFIAGAARLMLAMLERCVTDRGGVYAMCDTDSMAIVATERGGLVPCPGGSERLGPKDAVRALAWAEVDGVVERFATLNPYDLAKVPGSILELEKENFARCGIGGEDHEPDCSCTRERRQLWCDAISAKRYALFNVDADGCPDLRKWSEHGLGHLLNPTDPTGEDRDWMRQLWEGIVREELGLRCAWPAWLDLPALSRLTVSGPELLRPFAGLNDGKSYAGQVKPFNFLLAAHVRPFGHPDGADPERFQLVAPFERDPRRWQRLPWTDRFSGERFRLSATAETGGAGVARVQTYLDVLADFRTHPEAKSAAPEGGPCTRRTVGLLRRRVVRPAYLVHVGKESNKLEEVEAGLEHDPEEVYAEYADPRRDPWRVLVLPVLRDVPARRLSEETGLAVTTVKAARNGRTAPLGRTRAALTRVAATFTRERMGELGLSRPTDDLAACAAFLDAHLDRDARR